MTLRGDSQAIAERVQMGTSGGMGGPGAFSVSDAGVLVYQTGLVVRSQFAWMDRTGKPLGTLGEQADYGDVALSPDGTRAAVSMVGRARRHA